MKRTGLYVLVCGTMLLLALFLFRQMRTPSLGARTLPASQSYRLKSAFEKPLIAPSRSARQGQNDEKASDEALSSPRPRVPSERPVRKGRRCRPVFEETFKGNSLAVVIDDFGYSLPIAREIASLPLNFCTWAILPDTPHGVECSDVAAQADIVQIVHLPMQAQGDPNGGRAYLIGVDTSPTKIAAEVQRLRRSFPYAVGVNNHRGSKATSDRRTMEIFARALAETGWKFLDSRTSSSSVAQSIVAAHGVPALRNSVFIDGKADFDYMVGQFNQTLKLARAKGTAIAICHARPGTLPFLRWLSRTDTGDVKLVTLNELWQQLPGLDSRRTHQ